MKKKLTFVNHHILTLFFTLGILITACSSDDSSNDPNSNNPDASCPTNIATIPTDFLKTYTGKLITPNVNTESGTLNLTISESGSNCQEYTINFSDNIPPLTGIKFVDITKDERSFIYNNTDDKIIITLELDQENNRQVLGIFKSSDPIISFGSNK
ncbi:hypothetical protein [Aquimarina agarilytica]|uniref:hypothetical protein n=1 Tax=Aquimarina agarilytica TaxID=1087449 RepID=UPI000287D41E|nr:hypothetical protein [Aquimarina agarilytica]